MPSSHFRINFRCLGPEDVEQATTVVGREPVAFVGAQRYRAELGRGTFRPEWTWVAEESGRVVARAVWWGRPEGAQPLVLDCLWVAESVAERSNVAGRLLSAAHRSFQQQHGAVPEVFRMTLPNDWHGDSASRTAVAWRRDAAAAVGFTHEVERLQFRHILDAITRSHASRHAERITATTDLTNHPMVAAFGRAGYRNTETRVLLSAP